MIEVVAKSLVDAPEEVRVSAVGGSQTVVFELKVSKQDIGKIIGKGGQTAISLRTILIGAATKLRIRAVLEILE